MQQTIIPEIVVEVPNQPRRKHPGYYRRYQVAKMLKRGRETLNNWDSLLILNNNDYRDLSLGCGKPWHPYQVELLAKISEYQYRGNNPQKNRDENQIIEFINRHQNLWTEENWRNNNYSLPNPNHDQNTQRAC